MRKAMKARLLAMLGYWLDRLGEASTWQGIGFFLTLVGSKLGAGLDWGAAAALGGAVSGGIKMLFPDAKAKP